MDAAARKALGHLIRTELVADFDRVAAELERLDAVAVEWKSSVTGWRSSSSAPG